jgi:glycosyltransferase involved in cell wall biosynthesis
MPKVSVMIPCYNHGKYLDEAVGSVLAQSFADFEIIVVDDGSTDPFTQRLFEDYQRPKTRVIRTANFGLPHARNIAIASAGGEYILSLDADDRIAPAYLEKAVALLDADPSLGIVHGEVEYFGAKTGLWEIPPFDLDAFLVHNLLPNACFFRRSAWQKVGGYKEELRRGHEDWEFWLSLIEAGAKIGRIPEVVSYYRQAENSATQAAVRNVEQGLMAGIKYHPRLYLEHWDAVAEPLLERLCKARREKKSVFRFLHTKIGKSLWLTLLLERA